MKRTIAIALLIGIAAVRAGGQERRPMVIEDLFNIQAMTDVRMSPDGTSIAVVIQRAWSDPETYRPYPMFGNDQADIWILRAGGGPPRNITHGRENGSGYWNPVWSPDGERLALLSTEGGDNVRAYVWEKRSGRLKRVVDRGVDTTARTNATGDANPLQWVDRTRLLIITLPEGEQPLYFRVRRQTRRIASEAWKKVEQGQQPTSSVLEGGIAAGPARSGQLLLVDVATTPRTQVLAEGAVRYALLSPDREHVSVIALDRRLTARPGTPPSRLGIITLRDAPVVRWVDDVFNPTVAFGAVPLRWSPRGSALAVLGSARAEPDSPRAVFVVSSADLSVRRTADIIAPSALAWSEGEQLLVRGERPRESGRADWWSVSSASEPRNLTGPLNAVPGELMRTRNPNEVIGLVDGALWSFDTMTGSHRTIDAGGRSLGGLLWPEPETRVTDPVTTMIARARDSNSDALLRIDLSQSGATTTFPQPPRATTVAGFDPVRNFVVFTAPQDPDGTFLWTGAAGTSDFAKRIALNEQLAGIAGAERTLIDYRSTDGQELKGMLLLPVGYQKGTRYPLITWVYPGYLIRSLMSASDWAVKNHAHPDNLHVFAGRGYAVLIPSMPAGSAGDLRDLALGVLPAVDRVVELGIADQDRVGLIGQSGGGSATYGLITQTTRFKAAVAMNGFSNRISAYGTFSGETRYTDDFDDKFAPWGDPPWSDPERAIKNSPITFIDRVNTPLLILHGDVDYVPIQQAEEVFTSLSRLGKRVRFVRYWGESHGVGDSPANVRDRWRQIFRWFDTYLRDAR
jgi:dipeptidyl aminopeptidase/acylaminoacyl peptidase